MGDVVGVFVCLLNYFSGIHIRSKSKSFGRKRRGSGGGSFLCQTCSELGLCGLVTLGVETPQRLPPATTGCWLEEKGVPFYYVL